MREQSQLLDHELLADAVAGRVSALAELYHRYAPVLLAVGRRVSINPAAAEDLVHDVFLEAWRCAGSYARERGSVRTWLLVRLRSRALDRLRADQLRLRQQQPGLGAAQLGEAAHDELQRAPDRRLALQALTQLDEQQREALELAYFEGLSAREIALRIHAPIGTVKSRLASGLARLRRMVIEGQLEVGAEIRAPAPGVRLNPAACGAAPRFTGAGLASAITRGAACVLETAPR